MSEAPSHADTLLHPSWTVPVLPRGVVLENHSVAVTDGRISAIVPRSEAEAIEAAREVALDGHALLPGLINCHGHAAMTLLRGYADDQPLMTWLEHHIWPAEAAHVNDEFVADGVELAVTEMLRSGITTFSDMYLFPDTTASTAQRLGMRCQIAFPIIDAPSAWARDIDEYISKGLEVRDTFKHSALVSTAFGPHSPYTVSHDTLARVGTLAAELDAAVQIHLHETAAEVLQAVEAHGERPLDSLNRLGLLGPRTQAVHMTDLGDQDIALLAQTGTQVVHCPRSNMKLASGTCPVDRLAESGVNVALGSDSAASNNHLNLFAEMQAAALLGKLSNQNPATLPAADVLAMATINGARALGLADQTGSLEVGKCADIIAVDLSSAETQPLYNPLSALVYACNGSQVSHSWVNGELVMADRIPQRVDMEALASKTRRWQARISPQT